MSGEGFKGRSVERESDMEFGLAFQQSYENPYESSIHIIFSLASTTSSIVFAVAAFILYNNNNNNIANNDKNCSIGTIYGLLLTNGILDVLLGLGLIVFGTLGIIMNLSNSLGLLFKVINLGYRTILMLVMFAIAISLSIMLWGGSCATQQKDMYYRLNIFMHCFWIVNYIFLFIVLYMSGVKFLKDWETTQQRS